MGQVGKVVTSGSIGALAGAGIGASILPDGTPWYGYVVMTFITTILPMLVTIIVEERKRK